MRLITVWAPKGEGRKVVNLALELGISQVTLSEKKIFYKSRPESTIDAVDLHTNTRTNREFIDNLITSDFYNPETYSFSTRHPESVISLDPPEKETIPVERSSVEVYEELWQFCQITKSFIGRVFLSSLLAAYGVKEGYMPLIIAGLLFLPYHHSLLGMAAGSCFKEWRFLKQALYAFLISTILILLGGIVIGLITEPDIKFTQYAHTPLLFSFFISVIIGIAAALGTIDDAGRRELIGLAATAHLSIYPMWFGLKFIFGFDPSDKPLEFLLVFLMDVITIITFAFITYKILKTEGEGIRKIVNAVRYLRK